MHWDYTRPAHWALIHRMCDVVHSPQHEGQWFHEGNRDIRPILFREHCRILMKIDIPVQDRLELAEKLRKFQIGEWFGMRHDDLLEFLQFIKELESTK